jgi:ABC-type branched-subunit amino acid transport system ATPase component
MGGTGSAVGCAPDVAPRATSVVLDLEDVSVHFGGVRALDGVSLSITEGEICGLIGPNGAGKTTLFDVISGVRPLSSGRVTFQGRDVTSASATARSRMGLRRTFQRVQTFGWLSVEDNILVAIEWRGGGAGFLGDLLALPARRRGAGARRSDIDDVLGRCGLTAVRHEPAGSLPLGLARMVELARAVIDRPSLVLLDEPTSGLDRAEADRLGSEIQALRDEHGCSILLVEHDVDFVMRQCDRIAVLDLGRVLTVGAPEEIRGSAEVRRAYLGEA